MREYIKLFWEDAPEGEPSFILYEVDADNHRFGTSFHRYFSRRSYLQ